jgi:hypothetical protein
MRTGRKPGVDDIDPVIDNERLYSLSDVDCWKLLIGDGDRIEINRGAAMSPQFDLKVERRIDQA